MLVGSREGTGCADAVATQNNALATPDQNDSRLNIALNMALNMAVLSAGGF